MKTLVFEGQHYEINQGRDVGRGGVYLELMSSSGTNGGALAEVFLYEATGDIVFNSFAKEIAIELVDILVDEARQTLRVKS